MKFPEWAPTVLVNLFNGENGMTLDGEVAREALERLLTDAKMQEAWRVIGKQSSDVDLVLFTGGILSEYCRYSGQSPLVKSKKIKTLECISAAALELAVAIEQSDIDNESTPFRWWSEDEVLRAWTRIQKKPDIPFCMLLHGRESEDVVFTPQGHFENHFSEESPSMSTILRRLSDDAKQRISNESMHKNQRANYRPVVEYLGAWFKKSKGSFHCGTIAQIVRTIYGMALSEKTIKEILAPRSRHRGVGKSSK